jgi:hypothetical protein
MNNTLSDSQSQGLSHLEKAEAYYKSGLNAQVQYELEQAKQLDPYIVHEDRYKALIAGNVNAPSIVQKAPDIKTAFRIGAGILFVNALLGIIFLIISLISGDSGGLNFDTFVQPIVDIIIGVNLWQLNAQSQRRTLLWAAIGLVIFGGQALVSGDYLGLILQAAFDGSLILLLAGTPSKVRTIAAVLVFAIGYLGLICLGLTFIMLGALSGTV